MYIRVSSGVQCELLCKMAYNWGKEVDQYYDECTLTYEKAGCSPKAIEFSQVPYLEANLKFLSDNTTLEKFYAAMLKKSNTNGVYPVLGYLMLLKMDYLNLGRALFEGVTPSTISAPAEPRLITCFFQQVRGLFYEMQTKPIENLVTNGIQRVNKHYFAADGIFLPDSMIKKLSSSSSITREELCKLYLAMGPCMCSQTFG